MFELADSGLAPKVIAARQDRRTEVQRNQVHRHQRALQDPPPIEQVLIRTLLFEISRLLRESSISAICRFLRELREMQINSPCGQSS